VQRLERPLTALRRSALLDRQEWLWRMLKPVSRRVLQTVGRRGLARVINGTDEVRIDPSFSGLPETYEPEVWQQFMREIRAGDVIADIGAHVGLYSIAASLRLDGQATILSFEPDPRNRELLERHIELNRVGSSVTPVAAAVGDATGTITFQPVRIGSCAHVDPGTENGVANPWESWEEGSPTSISVPVTTLDTFFAGRAVDIMKIDIEGYETAALRGGRWLFMDTERAPRTIFIEVHPFAYPPFGTSIEELLSLLDEYGYAVTDVFGGNRVREQFTAAPGSPQGQIVARKSRTATTAEKVLS
jgi:FkbM family methyltransferase